MSRRSFEDALSENARIVRPAFLDKAQNQKDLIRRLRKLTTVLQTDESIEANDSTEWPGVAALAQTCASLLRHKDKQVRLYSTLACMELFAIYAPECPWDPPTICRIFSHTIQQIANLAHCTSAQAGNDFNLYTRILHLLAQVRIGVVLVELATECKDEVPPSSTDEIESFGSSQDTNTSNSSTSSSRDKLSTTPRGRRRSILTQNLGPERDVEPPLPLLVQFFHTMLHSVRREHAPTVQMEFVQALAACLEEYSPSGVTVPIPVLDEILLAIASGPTTLLTDPHAKVKKGQPLPQKAVENATYNVAAKILQVASSRLVTPAASLLSGLLQVDTYTVGASHISADPEQAWSGTDVWSVIRYLFRVHPSLLTSVWGTLRDCLTNPDTPQRLVAVQLVGHVFTARPAAALEGNFALFGAWLQRQNDVQADIRKALLPTCLSLTAHWAHQSAADLSTLPAQALNDTTKAVEALIVSDTTPAVRLQAIHTVCEALYRPASLQWNPSITARFLKAVGKRVSARSLNERQDALTGLVKLYEKNHLRGILQPVVEDESAEVVREVLHPHIPQKTRRRQASASSRNRSTSSSRSVSPLRRALWYGNEGGDEDDGDDADPYGWIPRALFCAVSFTDMRHRVVQLVDEGILPKTTSGRPTARAVGLALVLDALRDDDENLLVDLTTQASPAMRYLLQLMSTKASLQERLKAYLAKRQEWRSLERGTEESMACEAQALELLRAVAELTDGPKEMEVLKVLHRARDKHIFRLLGNLSTPLQQSTNRVAEELPRRCQTLSPDVATWMKQLTRRCGMGEFLNADIVRASAELAQECLEQGDVPACAALLLAVKIAAQVFPALCGQPGTFSVLRQLFSKIRSTKDTSLKKKIEEWRLVTALSSIMSDAASHQTRSADKDNYEKDDNDFEADAFRHDLMRLCTGDGTPTQAKHAVYTLSRLEKPDANAFDSPSANAMTRLVNKVASPLRLSATSEQQIALLSALSALADCAPDALASQPRGKKAIVYALEDILMGRRGDNEDDELSSGDDQRSEGKPSRGRSPKRRRHYTPKAQNILEDLSLSTPCRRICAAIAFLVSHIRAKFLKGQSDSTEAGEETLTKDQILRVFQLLTQILRGKGLPPNDRDRSKCDSRQERAALRQVAAINLLRLCDTRLGLEKICLSTDMWHTLGGAFLDEEKIVRESVMEEFTHMLKGTGVFGLEESKQQAAAPSLRFVAFVCLCVDSDSSQSSLAANASAAILGNATASVKSAASTCVTSLRSLCDAMYNTCRANGAEKQFENVHKMKFMPEYTVPYAIHLLALRRETPSMAVPAAPSSDDEEEDASSVEDKSNTRRTVDNEAKEKILVKRLKALFDPLIDTLGDGADNISFLLRMTEILGKQFAPVPLRSASLTEMRHVADLKSKLDKILSTARASLLEYIKTDVNLEQYPAKVQIPGSLFKKWSSKSGFLPNKPSSQVVQERTVTKKRPSDAAASPSPEARASPKKRRVETPAKSPMDSPRVHFSPELTATAPDSLASKSKQKSFGGISPIRRTRSPFASPVAESSSVRETQTVGSSTSTPASIRGMATIQSTQNDGDTEMEEASETSSRRISSQKSATQRSLDMDEESEHQGSRSTNTEPSLTQDSILDEMGLGTSPKSPSRRTRRGQKPRQPKVTDSGDSSLDDSHGESPTVESSLSGKSSRSRRSRRRGKSPPKGKSSVKASQENMVNAAQAVEPKQAQNKRRGGRSTRSLRVRK